MQRSPDKIFIHDDWNALITNYDADLSLLRFKGPRNRFTIGQSVWPICLWDSGDEPPEIHGRVTHWGKIQERFPYDRAVDIPSLVTVQIQTKEQCFLGNKTLFDLSSNRTICAGLRFEYCRRDDFHCCRGDSGGGLFTEVDGVNYLKGVESSSLIDVDCDGFFNSIYADVAKFSGWIKKIIGRELSATQAAETAKTSPIKG